MMSWSAEKTVTHSVFLTNVDRFVHHVCPLPTQDSTPLIVPGLIFGFTALSAGLASLMLPETRGKPLPDFVHQSVGKERDIEMEERKNEDATLFTSTV